MTNTKMVFLHAITPVHSGTGQAAAVIDLPIAREKATGWPVIPASSIKGVLRDEWENNGNQEHVKKAFGSPEEAGALCFGDQRIVCLPVRSFFGTFAYVTCPLVLRRLKRDADALEIPLNLKDIPNVTGTGIAVTKETVLKGNDNKVYLEDLDLGPAAAGDGAGGIAAAIGKVVFDTDAGVFAQRFAVVSDEVFSFLCEAAVEVAARVRLEDETKTVAYGGLWYEEAVPAETIFAGAVMLAGHAKRNGGADLLEKLNSSLIQVGGDASVGRGLCRMVVAK